MPKVWFAHGVAHYKARHGGQAQRYRQPTLEAEATEKEFKAISGNCCRSGDTSQLKVAEELASLLTSSFPLAFCSLQDCLLATLDISVLPRSPETQAFWPTAKNGRKSNWWEFVLGNVQHPILCAGKLLKKRWSICAGSADVNLRHERNISVPTQRNILDHLLKASTS